MRPDLLHEVPSRRPPARATRTLTGLLPLFDSLGMRIFCWKPKAELDRLRESHDVIRECRYCMERRRFNRPCPKMSTGHEVIYRASNNFRQDELPQFKPLNSRCMRAAVGEVGKRREQLAAMNKVEFYPWVSHLPNTGRSDLPGASFTFQPVYERPMIEDMVWFILSKNGREPEWVR